LVGASPELLLSRRGALVVSAPLAGSVPRSRDASEDEQRAARLLRSAKDRHEHRFVVEQILDGLRPFTTDLHFEREPTVTATHSMWHLSTRISGRLRDLGTSSLRLALALHPTPAVCGTPTERAADFIAAAEPFDRGYFTGTLGHMDATGDGDWIVTIRCAEVGPSGVRVFAGAGIVEHSVPALELEETDAKMQTMLAALGAGGAP
jgi:isochorismate synthase